MDDDIVVSKMVSSMLEKAFGYDVIILKNGTEVLEYYKESQRSNNPLTAMIFDLTIPGGMGGKETIEEIRKIDNRIPVFVSSGYSRDPVISNPQEYGFTASIIKPFRISELSKLLDKYLKR